MSESPLQTLPVEILRYIVSHSTSDSSLKLMRTCQTLAIRIEPLIYESIEWNIERTYTKATVHQFLHKLVKRPEVGLSVRSFTMKGRFSQHVYSGVTRFDIDQLVQRAEQIHPSVFEDHKTREWWHMIYSNSPIMLVALMILNCPNIQYLTPWTGYHEPEPRLVFLRKALSTLPKLRNIDWGTGYSHIPRIPWYCQPMEDIFRLPNLRELRTQVTDTPLSNVSAGSYTGFQDTLPQIQSLELHNSLIHEESLQKLLTTLPHLTSLRLGIWRETQSTGIHSTFVGSYIRCDEMMTALRVVGRNLEHLAISAEFYTSKPHHKDSGGPYLSDDVSPRFWGTIGSMYQLQEFSRLKSLELDPVLLFGWDAEHAMPLKGLIPTSLRHLKLRADFAACTAFKAKLPVLKNAVRDFVAVDRGKFELEGLTIVMFNTDFYRYELVREELVDICEKGVLKFGIERLVG